MLLADVQYNAVQLITGSGKVNLIAVFYRLLLIAFKVVPQVVQAMLSHLFYMLAQFLKMLELIHRGGAHQRRKQGHGIAELRLVLVRERCAGVVQEGVTVLLHWRYSPSPIAGPSRSPHSNSVI